MGDTHLNLKFQLHNHGFEVHEQACPQPLLTELCNEFAPDAAVDWELLDHSALVRSAAHDGVFQQIAARELGDGCFPTHAILYNRNDSTQPWHQDTTVRDATKGFIEPSDRSIYNSLLSVRLSLDDCTFFDGALKLCPTSYKHGVLTTQEIRGHSMRPFSSPEMKAGDILVMHPLTIHASAASTTGKPRRVIHVVYAAASLRAMLGY